MNKSFLLALLFTAAGASSGLAQEISFDNGSVVFDSSDFTTANDVSTLSLSTASNYYSDLNTQLGLSAGVASALGLTGAGWIIQDSTGELVITDPSATSGNHDPSAAYGYFNINNTSSTQTVTTSMTTDFDTPFSFSNGATVTQSFGITLTSSNSGVVTASATQTGTLSGSGVSNFTAGTPISTGPLATTSTQHTVAASYNPTPETIYPPDVYDALTISTTFTYSPGAIVSLSGSTDVENNVTESPEPKTMVLLFFAAAGGLLFHLRRRQA